MATRILLSGTLLWLCTITYAQPRYAYAVLKERTSAERVIATRNLFDKEISHMDSSDALNAISELRTMADKEEDVGLQIFLTEALGLYFKDHDTRYETPAEPYLDSALELAIQHDRKEQQADIYHNMGLLYYHEGKFAQAFEALFKANTLIQFDIGYARYPFTSRYLYDLGRVYYDFGNYRKANLYLQEALRYTTVANTCTIETYNTLGLTYERTEDYDSAAIIFQKTIDLARNLHHAAWEGIASGNLGMVYHALNHYDAAIPLLQADYRLSMENGEWSSAAATLCALADIHLKQSNGTLAAAELQTAYPLMQRQSNDRLRLHYMLVKAELCKQQQQYECAFVYLDTARMLQEQITRRKDGILLTQAEKKVEVEKYLTEMKLLESEKSKAVLFRNSIITVILLLLLIAAQLIFRQQLKQRKNRELLNNAVYQLNSYIESLQEKNELIVQFKNEIAQMHSLPDYRLLQKEKEEIADKLKKYTIVTEDHWNEFRHLFEKVQKGFFDTLKRKFPSLTQSEIRLLALMKLNLSRKEMAEMLGVSPDSIKKTRQRIRKKIDLPEEMDLEGLVVTI